MKWILFSVVALLFVGCGQNYQTYERSTQLFGGVMKTKGYKDTKLAEHHYLIEVIGERKYEVMNLGLLRSAEVCHKSGRDWFTLQNYRYLDTFGGNHITLEVKCDLERSTTKMSYDGRSVIKILEYAKHKEEGWFDKLLPW
jgi:hypothetical protein